MALPFRISALFFLSMIVLGGCDKKQADTAPTDPAFGAYIYAYTSGVISSVDPIIVQLAQPYAGPLEKVSPLPENLFDFEPEIQGRAFWVDAQTLRFEPSKPLPNGQMYQGLLKLSMLFKTEADLEEFPFDFQTVAQDIKIHIDGLEGVSTTDLALMTIKGKISTADVASTEELQKAISAKQGDRELPLKIYAESRTRYAFTIDDVQRGDQKSRVEINWDLALADAKGEMMVEVPGIGDFEVTGLSVNQAPEQHVVIFFSDPIANQNLKGLIGLEGTENPRLVIDGNKVVVYPQSKLSGARLIRVDGAVKNLASKPMGQIYTHTVNFTFEKPAVRLLDNKAVVPSQEKGLLFPFEAVSLEAVDIYITKIFQNNILQYYQNNDLGGNYSLSRVGRHIYRKHLDLRQLAGADLNSWNRYYIDLAEVVNIDPGALYEVDIRFKRDYAIYPCDEDEESYPLPQNNGWISDGTYFVDEYWNDYEYNWEENENPCHSSYYSQWNSRARKTVMATNLGLTAKMGGNGEILVVVNHLLNTKALSGVKIEVYDGQQQLMATANTSDEGFAVLDCPRQPFAVIASLEKDRAYLKVNPENSLSLADFNVEGSDVQSGIKGFIYGERGVWRPGDSLYLNFILEDSEKILPNNHPVKLELFDPRGQLVKSITKINNLNGFYDFRTKTNPDAPTGNYTANISVGNRSYTKNLKIETVKPNRLKVALDIKQNRDKLIVDLESTWLHGAIASNLKADVSMSLRSTKTTFKGYENYHFDNYISTSFSSEALDVFEGKLDETGKVKFDVDMRERADQAPGKLKASFSTKVYEPGGNFSVDFYSYDYAPYKTFAGMKVPEGELWGGALEIDRDYKVDLISLSAEGKLAENKALEVKLYRINNRWWYDRYDGSNFNYLSSGNYREISSGNVALTGGKGTYNLNVPKSDWGRYLLVVKDPISGHSSAQFIYFDWPYWIRANRTGSEAGTILAISSDKETYGIDEAVKLSFPSPEKGRALICIENGSKILEKFWVETTAGETKFQFTTNAEMAPNIYAHISILQPHAQTVNDRPIRMYGVIPLGVENPKTHLHPQITSAEVFRPERKAKITVSERDGRAMTYTLAMVDEGLLGLTRYKTPDPHSVFYAPEALGVKTWDLYDMVVGAITGKTGVLGIGGDEDAYDPSQQKAMRFKPVVTHLGPFYLPKGKKADHEISVPNYVGAVRLMVVAGGEDAYGSIEKEIPVRSPVMVLGTLPRVLGPGEKVSLPVNVFAMEPQVKNVDITIETSGPLKAIGGTSQAVSFSKTGDKILFFDLETTKAKGIAKIRIAAKAGSEVSTYEVEIDVRPPNPRYTEVVDYTIEAGSTWTGEVNYFGLKGTNEAVLELSVLPSINLEKRLDYLVNYPHGCIEQTTSAAFPQLYLSNFLDLGSSQKIGIDNNVKTALNALRKFQLPGGGLSYWPGGNTANTWGTTYAGHFMLEAEAKGYSLPIGLKSQWLRYQKSEARNWSTAEGRNQPYMQREQAYRLYTLALAGSTEMGAMNLLKSQSTLDVSARWLLALAYAEIGQTQTAESLIKGQSTDIPDYTELSFTYGSDLRDEAIILAALHKLKMKTEAAQVARNLALNLGSEKWLSTQTMAQMLRSLALYVANEGMDSGLQVKITEGTETKSFATGKTLISQNVNSKTNGTSLKVENTGKQTLYGRLLVSGKPLEGKEKPLANNLKMEIRYLDNNFNTIDISNLKQGTDFIAEVRVVNPSAKGNLYEMALEQVFPSGWEILNPRMGDGTVLTGNIPDYQDVRDDAVMTYFDIPRSQSRLFRMRLNASYKGRFYLPAVVCRAMYDESIIAVEPGKWVVVD